MALTQHDATIVMGMVVRGDNRHDIAAWFGVNQARIAEVEDGTMYGHVNAAPAADLPPKGAPGPKGRRLRGFVKNALNALEGGDVETATKHLQNGIAIYNQNEA